MSVGYEYIDEFTITIDVNQFRDEAGDIDRPAISKLVETTLDTILEEDGLETDSINKGTSLWRRSPVVTKVGSWEIETSV